MVTTYPVKALNFIIRMLNIIYKKMTVSFIGNISCTSLFFLPFSLFLSLLTFKLKIPRIHICRRVIFNMLNHSATFQNQCFQAFFAKLFGCPSTTDSGTYHYCIVILFYIHITIVKLSKKVSLIKKVKKYSSVLIIINNF